jgi:hypothetical protein
MTKAKDALPFKTLFWLAAIYAVLKKALPQETVSPSDYDLRHYSPKKRNW